MSALDHLSALARGARPADDGLLGNTRCAWGRGEIVGEVTPLFADIPGSMIFTRSLIRGEAIDDAFVEELVDRVLLPILTTVSKEHAPHVV